MSKFPKFLEGFEHRGFNFKNKIGLTAMTRCRSEPNGTPNDLNKTYYIQRAHSAGLITTEAMGISQKVNPWYNSCSVATKEATEKWQEIIKEIHGLNSYIFAQLVHGGRTVHPDFAEGEHPVAPSPVAMKGQAHTKDGKKDIPIAHEVTKEQIKEIVDLFKHSIVNAVEAGFDGIEFHGANGYLIDQFLRSGTNNRTDEYGGSVENRARFLLELVDMALEILPPSKIGVKLSPVGRYNEMYEANPEELLKYVLQELNKRNILYVLVMEPEASGDGVKQIPNVIKLAREHFKGLVISDGSIPIEERHRRLEHHEADITNFGMMLWANPDLSERIKNDWPLNKPDFQYVYSGGEKSYTDIPSYKPEN